MPTWASHLPGHVMSTTGQVLREEPCVQKTLGCPLSLMWEKCGGGEAEPLG